MITMHLRIPIERQHWAVHERIVCRDHIELIRGDCGADLDEIYGFFCRYVRPDEVGALSTWREQLRRSAQDPSTQHMAVLLRDPLVGRRIVCGVFGSVQHGVLALRGALTAAEGSYRRSALAQVATGILCGEAERWSQAHGHELETVLAEGGDSSEGFWNRLFVLRRVYICQKDGGFAALPYRLPPPGSSDGDGQLTRSGRLHLLLACRESSGDRCFTAAGLRRALAPVWRAWYDPGAKRPAVAVAIDGTLATPTSQADVLLHQHVLRHCDDQMLRCFSRDERVALQAAGVRFVDGDADVAG